METMKSGEEMMKVASQSLQETVRFLSSSSTMDRLNAVIERVNRLEKQIPLLFKSLESVENNEIELIAATESKCRDFELRLARLLEYARTNGTGAGPAAHIEAESACSAIRACRVRIGALAPAVSGAPMLTSFVYEQKESSEKNSKVRHTTNQEDFEENSLLQEAADDSFIYMPSVSSPKPRTARPGLRLEFTPVSHNDFIQVPSEMRGNCNLNDLNKVFRSLYDLFVSEQGEVIQGRIVTPNELLGLGLGPSGESTLSTLRALGLIAISSEGLSSGRRLFRR